MVGSIYNMGVWDNVAAAWVKAGVRRTLEGEAVVRLRYQETGLSSENGGCVGDRHIMVQRGSLQEAFIEARLGDLPKENTTAVQHVP